MAAPDARVLGLWGTSAQCQELPILTGGTLRAAPFDVSLDWLNQRDLWCRLTWFPSQDNGPSLYTRAQAICGEDGNRGYWLSFVYEKSTDALTLFWDETLKNGPLARCEPKQGS